MILMLIELLFFVVWLEEVVPRQWREGHIVNLFKKVDKEHPCNNKVLCY